MEKGMANFAGETIGMSIEIDGSFGEGGGQIVRTALALSCIKNIKMTIYNIRAGRRNPGLNTQIVEAIKLMATLTNAEVEGCTVGSETLRFRPKSIDWRDQFVDIRTAGSIFLAIQPLLILATIADSAANIEVIGGTDVMWSPPADYCLEVMLPTINRFGMNTDIVVHDRGFYPKGGGRVTVHVRPASLVANSLLERGALKRIRILSCAEQRLSSAKVAERQAQAARILLAFLHTPIDVGITYTRSLSAGSAIVLAAEYDGSVLGASALGERGLPAERVGEDAAIKLIHEINGTGVLDSHMADQIVPFLAIAGGEVSVNEMTTHCQTNIDVCKAFGLNIESDGTTIRAGEEQTKISP